jgi:hypothetical protein
LLGRSDGRPVVSVIEENGGTELELVFGARATIRDMTLDQVTCGEAVLLRGS